jgi:hypothetical protein
MSDYQRDGRGSGAGAPERPGWLLALWHGPNFVRGQEVRLKAFTHDGALYFMDYARLVGAHARKVVIVTGAVVILGLIYLHLATYKYTVTLEVTQVEDSEKSSYAGALSSLSSVASLAGIDLSSGSKTQMDLYMAALKSSTVADKIAANPALLHGLFYKKWDAKRGAWRRPNKILLALEDASAAIVGMPTKPWHPPGALEVRHYIEREVDMTYEPISPIATITYKNRDPAFAKAFLLAMHQAADALLRKRTLQRADEYIDYINRKLNQVTATDIRQAMISTLMIQERRRMAASASMSYSVDVFAPPTPSIRPTSPNAPIVLIACLLLGAITGMTYVIFRYRPRPGDEQ